MKNLNKNRLQEIVGLLWEASDAIASDGMGDTKLAGRLGDAANDIAEAYDLHNDSTFQLVSRGVQG